MNAEALRLLDDIDKASQRQACFTVQRLTNELRVLLAAPVGIVLPAHKPRAAADWEDLDRCDLMEDAQFAGWNACLDKVKELNP